MLTRMDCFGLTDQGLKRPTNQDQYLIADLNKSLKVHRTSLRLDNQTRIYGGSQGKLLLVADGMGGEADGERASTVAVDKLTTYVLNSLAWCFRLEEGSEADFEDELREALKYCQDQIHLAAGQDPTRQNMGTTLTMAYIVWPRAFVVHVGDSRCYLLRDQKLTAVTEDHTVGQALSKSAQMTEEKARDTPRGHWLWNALGGKSEKLLVDCYRISLTSGDGLLLCTDGLYDMVSHDEMTEVMNSDCSAEDACHELVKKANDHGGKDNITVIVSQFDSPELAEREAFVEAEVPLGEMIASDRDSKDKQADTIDFEPVNKK